MAALVVLAEMEEMEEMAPQELVVSVAQVLLVVQEEQLLLGVSLETIC
jgi:hypothetical protein